MTREERIFNREKLNSSLNCLEVKCARFTNIKLLFDAIQSLINSRRKLNTRTDVHVTESPLNAEKVQDRRKGKIRQFARLYSSSLRELAREVYYELPFRSSFFCLPFSFSLSSSFPSSILYFLVCTLFPSFHVVYFNDV